MQARLLLEHRWKCIAVVVLNVVPELLGSQIECEFSLRPRFPSYASHLVT
jgi:hypothetical protein